MGGLIFQLGLTLGKYGSTMCGKGFVISQVGPACFPAPCQVSLLFKKGLKVSVWGDSNAGSRRPALAFQAPSSMDSVIKEFGFSKT